MQLSESLTITVIGGGNAERTFALHALVPVLSECVRVLSSATHTAIPVHVTYCNACGERLLPAVMGEAIGSEHVNGGISMDHNMGVLVFRRQDARKVLIHELLHLFKIDAPLRDLSVALEARAIRPHRGLWATRRGSIHIGLNEAYTDAIACVVFCGDIERAKTHAVAAAVRVLAHFGFGELPFTESTHAFSYYVVKAAMLVNGDEFASLLRHMRDGLTPDDPAQVIKFMGKSLRSVAFRSALSFEIERHERAPEAGARHLRMTDGRPGLVSFSKLGVLI